MTFDPAVTLNNGQNLSDWKGVLIAVLLGDLKDTKKYCWEGCSRQSLMTFEIYKFIPGQKKTWNDDLDQEGHANDLQKFANEYM